jgi:23S rRNA-/tRNA-specific pseudouridylate synthase
VVSDSKPVEGVRLQKVLAAAGVGSRRACEELIANRRVTVDGKVAILGQRVDPRKNAIHVDGDRIPTAPDIIVLALNKPKGVVSTMIDPDGRPCVGDYVATREERLFHVGRLDVDTEGLLLITNDGDLSNQDLFGLGSWDDPARTWPPVACRRAARGRCGQGGFVQTRPEPTRRGADRSRAA